jgi:hypothetical protein
VLSARPWCTKASIASLHLAAITPLVRRLGPQSARLATGLESRALAARVWELVAAVSQAVRLRCVHRHAGPCGCQPQKICSCTGMANASRAYGVSSANTTFAAPDVRKSSFSVGLAFKGGTRRCSDSELSYTCPQCLGARCAGTAAICRDNMTDAL